MSTILRPLTRLLAGQRVRSDARRQVRRAAATVAAAALAASAIALTAAPVPARAGTPGVSLMPGGGQYVPITAVKIADTQDGTGGVARGPLPAGATMTVQAAGVGQIPAADTTDLYVVIGVISPTARGCVDSYDADDADPGICSISFDPGTNVSGSDLVTVSDSGEVSFTNESSGSAQVTATVLGYFQTAGASAAGDTYASVPTAAIVDTRSGLGAPKAQIPAGGSLTVQVTGKGGIPTDAAGAALYLGASTFAGTAGTVTAYPAGGTPSGTALLSYTPGRVVHDLYLGPLPASGELTLVNQGTSPVDLMVNVQGYLVSPSSSQPGGSYLSVAEDRVADTRDGTGGVPAAAVPAGGSITFTATGVDHVPASEVAAVAETVQVIGPQDAGFLSVYGASNPDSSQPGVNFYAGSSQGNGIVAAAVSAAGQQTVTNHSSGTVEIVVSVRGYFLAATAPDQPVSVAATVSGTSATVTWTAPQTDGGAAITGYVVTASPDSASMTVGPATYQATLTGLAGAGGDTFSVAAVNQAGTSATASFGPTTQTLSGTLLAPAPAGVPGKPVAGDQVLIYEYASQVAQLPAGGSFTPAPIGSATTDQNGHWSFSLPQFSALPAGVQADAIANNGFLNVEVDAYATGAAPAGAGQAAGVASTYLEDASAFESAWVGEGAQTAPPAGLTAPAPQTMTLTAPGPDNSSLDTAAAETGTWASQNDPGAEDSSGDLSGGPVDPSAGPPLDTYGYQSVGPDDTYNPNITYDGADLSSVTPQPFSILSAGTSCQPSLAKSSVGGHWTVIGEVHDSSYSRGSFSYDSDSHTTISVEVSVDGDHWSADGSTTVTNASSGITSNLQPLGPNDSRRALMYVGYDKIVKTYPACMGYPKHHKYWMWGTGIAEPSSGFPFMYGKKGALNLDDNWSAWDTVVADCQSCLIALKPGQGISLHWGAGQTFSLGASVLGVGFSSVTDLTHTTTQNFTAGNSKKYIYYVWADGGWLYKLKNPHRFFTYSDAK